MSALDRLFKDWTKARALADRFASRDLSDPIRQKWGAAAHSAKLALEDEERRLLDPSAELHP